MGAFSRHSNKREEIKEAQAGDIIAIVGLKDTTTGDTLCAVDAPVVLEKMDFPEPVIKVSCEPTSQKDADKLGEALNKLAAEDPSFRYSRDEESNQTPASKGVLWCGFKEWESELTIWSTAHRRPLGFEGFEALKLRFRDVLVFG